MKITQLMRRGFTLSLFTLLLTLIPGMAAAAGSEANVRLDFTGENQTFLIISAILGAVALAFGYWVKSSVSAMSPGNEKMQEVGLAIHQGAIAYLKQQFRTMIWFVLGIAVLLFFIYSGAYSSQSLGFFTAISFVAGVLASYVAGYVGMDMAVKANMRTAHAALTSYGNALTVSFRAGAVAGMITVGMGLLGATAIFWFGGADAMKLLIGFGFGGSLAALFMRVGGGIFTKAADVGADLVGKVEAGIPEDDARNPATIADNVGDNVGDCAGMAADIFESYEVTLVAAIVLGAATSQIFPQDVWMKLILFALMARGVGIVASIIGIMTVKGSDDIDADPLGPISKGFRISALLAAAGTFALAWYMMGGKPGQAISAVNLVPPKSIVSHLVNEVQAARDELAATQKVEAAKVKPSDIAKHARVVALDLPSTNPQQFEQLVGNLASYEKEQLDSIPGWDGYKEIPLDSPMLAEYSAMKQEFTPNTPNTYRSAKEYLESLRVFSAEVPEPDPSNPTAPAAGGPTSKLWFLASSVTDVKAQNPQAKFLDPDGAGPGKTEEGLPVRLYAKGDKLVVGMPIPGADSLLRLRPAPGSEALYKKPQEELKKVSDGYKTMMDQMQKLQAEADKLKGDAQVKKREELNKLNTTLATLERPTQVQIQQAATESHPAEWWKFALCIVFGILMAFGIERLTDHYVSLKGKPVNEIAAVATAGPAPMIISGFALACESSVFSVLAIVVALMTPLFIFPHAEYGSYILSFYGIALVGLGLLTTTGYILAMDTFGPISDNAQGVFEMSGAGKDNPVASKAVQRLDAAGNTTKALTKGFAIATAVVAAVALFHSFVEDAKLTVVGMPLEVPEIFLGLMIGGAAPFLFSAFSINAVGRAAFELIGEVRRQFKADPGIMAGTSKPNYGNCVAIVTAAAQKELLGPGILAIALPIAVGFGFAIGKEPVNGFNVVGAQALGGFLAGAILSGQLMAVLLANSGGMWDNAKKLIEDGMHGGKGTEAHKAGVVCDTVGDPFKDTAGPALNPLIKVMNLVALLMAPIVIAPHPQSVLIGVTLAAVAALVFAVYWSKRGSMASGLEAASGPAVLPAPVKSAADSGKRITVEDSDES